MCACDSGDGFNCTRYTIDSISYPGIQHGTITY